MGRFTGYVAVVDNPGGKFATDEPHMSPILKEITDRGLGYLDDGARPGSSQDISASTPTPSARADLVIDADAAPEAVDASLSRLVDLARKRGSAIGVASATPGSLERLARWTNRLDSMGVALVPLSALMSGTPGLSAQSNPSVSP
jgi:hypothetical protein